MHFIVPDSYNDTRVKNGIKNALKNFACKSAILSIISMDKHNCITKEKYEAMYKTNEKNEKRKDLSVGEDLETLIENIKNGKINKESIPEDGDRSRTFLLCSLDKDERKKLEQKDQAFMKTFFEKSRADVPEAEWKASEHNFKFSRAICYRNTYFIEE